MTIRIHGMLDIVDPWEEYESDLQLDLMLLDILETEPCRPNTTTGPLIIVE